MAVFNKHIWKQLIYITFTALLVTSCQSSDGGMPNVGDRTISTVGDGSISQQAVTENQQPFTSQAIKPQSATFQNPSPVKTVKPKLAKIEKKTTNKSSSSITNKNQPKLAKITKKTANKTSSSLAKKNNPKLARIQKTNATNKNSVNSQTVKPILATADTQRKNEVDKIKAVFYQNLQGLNGENLEMAMGVIDRNNPNYEKVKQLTQTLFQSADLKYELKQLDVIKIVGNEAKVKVTQTTRKIRGLAFRDNVSVSINTVKKYNGQWKIADTKTESVNYLN
ncbi:MAG TPA: hypothetical protein VK203_15340 [Nostocaceae cyanobacterium]|nr:hypothetical protein [Nostocaceae cyanobacterium]